MQNLDGNRGFAPALEQLVHPADGDNTHHQADAAASGGGQTWADTIAAWTAAEWDRLERNARALDRSEATHTLRVRHQHANAQRRHVRMAVTR